MSHGPYATDLALQDRFAGIWDTMMEIFPEVAEGSSNRHQVFEVADPEKWVPYGYAIVRVEWRGAAQSPGVIDCFSDRAGRASSGSILTTPAPEAAGCGIHPATDVADVCRSAELVPVSVAAPVALVVRRGRGRAHGEADRELVVIGKLELVAEALDLAEAGGLSRGMRWTSSAPASSALHGCAIRCRPGGVRRPPGQRTLAGWANRRAVLEGQAQAPRAHRRGDPRRVDIFLERHLGSDDPQKERRDGTGMARALGARL